MVESAGVFRWGRVIFSPALLGQLTSGADKINGETYRLRSEAPSEAVTIFQALGYRIPPRIVLLAKDNRDAKT